MKSEIRSTDIVGAWRLNSWFIYYEDDREPGAPFGQQPSGLLLYSSDDWMSATVHHNQRPQFPANLSPRKLDTKLITDAFWSYFHYAGPYRIEDDQVIHSVRHSLNPGFVGTDQVRRMKLNPPFLTLTGVEVIRGETRRHELIWQRVNPKEGP